MTNTAPIDPHRPVSVIGAGLAGALLALMLARRGLTVHLCDRRPDPRGATADTGRSINLALAARGIRALQRAGVMDRIRPLLIPMRGRMIHDPSGATTLQPYGQAEHEVIYSIGRAALNRVLIEEAACHPKVTLIFEQTALRADPVRDTLLLREDRSGIEREIELTPTIATDGAGSAIRHSLAAVNYLTVREEWLDHDYKELGIPPVDGKHALAPHALHIWPRGGFMLIALPNTDGSFTATLFLARVGSDSFGSLQDAAAVEAFLHQQFPDAVPLIPNLVSSFFAHPCGQLGTVHAAPWHVKGQVLLLGDAAHAIVPFHGQGMNAAFEDCAELDSLLDSYRSWDSVFDAFEQTRRPNTEAIAQMALENYTEMRNTVLDPGFVRRKALSLELERRFPKRFIPRYSMVMFHPEISYAQAQRRGEIQSQILLELDRQAYPLHDANPAPYTANDIDYALATRLITLRLSELSAT